jgi:hypothetical protein
MALAALLGVAACAAAATGIYYYRAQFWPHPAGTPMVDQTITTAAPASTGPIPVHTQSFLPPPKVMPEAMDQQAAASREAIPSVAVKAKSRKKKKLLQKRSLPNAAKAKP